MAPDGVTLRHYRPFLTGTVGNISPLFQDVPFGSATLRKQCQRSPGMVWEAMLALELDQNLRIRNNVKAKYYFGSTA
jgi:hypothetical protein